MIDYSSNFWHKISNVKQGKRLQAIVSQYFSKKKITKFRDFILRTFQKHSADLHDTRVIIEGKFSVGHINPKQFIDF